MTRALFIKEILPSRSFTTSGKYGQETVTAQPLILTDCINDIYGEAYGDVAKSIADQKAQVGDGCTVILNNQVVKRDGTTKDGQPFTIYENRTKICSIGVHHIANKPF